MSTTVSAARGHHLVAPAQQIAVEAGGRVVGDDAQAHLVGDEHRRCRRARARRRRPPGRAKRPGFGERGGGAGPAPGPRAASAPARRPRRPRRLLLRHPHEVAHPHGETVHQDGGRRREPPGCARARATGSSTVADQPPARRSSWCLATRSCSSASNGVAVATYTRGPGRALRQPLGVGALAAAAAAGDQDDGRQWRPRTCRGLAALIPGPPRRRRPACTARRARRARPISAVWSPIPG